MALAVVLGACAGVLMAGSGMVGQTLSALAEPAAALGLLVIALMMAGAERLGPRAMVFAAAAVSLPHGVLHGLESQGPAFLAGLVLTSLMLLAVGIALGRQFTSPEGQGAARLRRLTAAGFAGLGLVLAGLAA
jgi:hydrogenase/urease accessory protein HupE